MTQPETPRDTLIDGIHVLGGEMLNWSDSASNEGGFSSPLGVALLAHLGLTSSSRVLVIGPHSPGFISSLADSPLEVDALVRSWPDAQDGHRHTAGKSVGWYCGPAARFLQLGRRYDVVVALDGVERLEGADLPPLTRQQILTGLADVLTPEGTLLLGVGNPLGVTEILVPSVRDADHQWPPSSDDRPWSGLGEVGRACAEAGLVARTTLGAFPNRRSPTVLVSDDVLESATTDDRLLAPLARAADQEIAARPHLKDPRELSRAAVRAGLGLPLAPAWIIQLTRGEQEPPPGTLLVAEAADPGFWDACYSIAPTPNGVWTRRVLEEAAGIPRRVGQISREVSRLDGELPAGSSLETHLAGLCERYDLAGMRHVLEQWTSWLRGLSTDPEGTEAAFGDHAPVRQVLNGQHVFATLDNVIVTESGLAILDTSWRVDTAFPTDVIVLRSLRRFAQHLLTGAVRHPWPFGSSPDTVSRALGVMVGITVTEQLRHEAAALESLVSPPPSAWVLGDRDAAAALELTKGGRPLGSSTLGGLDEALAAVDRLTGDLAARSEQVDWLVRRIHVRERLLRKRRRNYQLILRSPEYLLGVRMLGAKTRFRLRRKDVPATQDATLNRWPGAPSTRIVLDPKLLPPGYPRQPESNIFGGAAGDDDDDELLED